MHWFYDFCVSIFHFYLPKIRLNTIKWYSVGKQKTASLLF
jgi:hypothetical protein